jgi:uncharacterized protein (DUF2147 family)
MKNLILTVILALFSITLFSQSDISGTWNTGDQNTLVKIEKVNDVYVGKIVSSDNSKAKIGAKLIKDVKLKNNKFKGEMYAPKKGEWYDAEFTKKGSILEIEISAGFMSKTVEWTKN